MSDGLEMERDRTLVTTLFQKQANNHVDLNKRFSGNKREKIDQRDLETEFIGLHLQ